MGGPQFKGVFCPVILLSCELSVSPCKVASLAHQSPTGFVVFLLLCVLALSIVPSLVLGTALCWEQAVGFLSQKHRCFLLR